MSKSYDIYDLVNEYASINRQFSELCMREDTMIRK